jgi:hypothetical protein
MLHGGHTISVTYMAFDVLGLDSQPTLQRRTDRPRKAA